ncbi:hypothetical protein E4U42_000435 [Claviceps africana]|uniref:Uncharacterized protein n=1 Tax=Claviceps africana TaxID=83212 RepID=A0A8K0J5E4_9HYPO|nr:hypothetical protein E4U42_000435 [Claviceps africana]
MHRTLPADEWRELTGWHGGVFGRLHGALDAFAEVRPRPDYYTHGHSLDLDPTTTLVSLTAQPPGAKREPAPSARKHATHASRPRMTKNWETV